MLDSLIKDKTQIFKYATMTFGVIIGLVAILMFSGKFPGLEDSSKKNTNKPTLNILGTLNDKTFRDSLTAYQTEGGSPFNVNYEYDTKEEVSRRLLEAASQGTGPDLVIADYATLLSLSSLFYVIPYTYMTELDFKSIYVDGTHILATPFGVSFYPILVDPQVTLFNKKIFSENGIINPPFYWSDLTQVESMITVLNSDSRPAVSAFGMGANNVERLADTLFTQIFQLGGNPAKATWGTTVEGGVFLNYITDLGLGGYSYTDVSSGLSKIIKFQTAFSDPLKTTFTWDETTDSDLSRFISGELGIYFGRSSDIDTIKANNPNLDLGIYFMPQLENSNIQAVSGDMYGIAVSRNTKDLDYAVEIAQTITSKSFSSKLSYVTGMAGARRDVLYGNNGSERSEVVGRSSLVMKLFYNNNPGEVNRSIYNLYDNILSGRQTAQSATENFAKDWGNIYRNY